MGKLAWGKHKITIVYVPETSSPIRQLALPQYILYLIPALAVFMAMMLVFWVNTNKNHHTDVVQSLQAQYVEVHDRLMNEQAEFARIFADQDEVIDGLQNQVTQFSRQAVIIQAQLLELTQLEQDLKRITDLVGPSSDQVVGVRSNEVESATASNIGGPAMDATEEGLQHMAVETQGTFNLLRSDINGLMVTLQNLKQALLEKKRMIEMTPSIWPTPSRHISSDFGVRRDPFTGKPGMHNGVDFAAKAGDPVYSTADGTVRSVAKDQSRGNYIEVDHAQGMATIYMHLSKTFVKSGDRLTKGQEIGRVGSTGRSTGPHLHYELLINHKPVNPRPFLHSTREGEL